MYDSKLYLENKGLAMGSPLYTFCLRNIFTDLHQNRVVVLKLHAQTFVPSKF